MEKKSQLVHLGSANKPHGIKGGFLFLLFNSEQSVLKVNSVITIYPKTTSSSVKPEGESHRIYNISFGNKTICYLEGITDRTDVESLLPFDIYYPRENFPKTNEDELYLNDLIGLKVIDPAGNIIGEVVSQYDNGAQPILKIRLDNETIEVPFVNVFFPEIDIEQGRLTLIKPEEYS